MQQLTLTFDGPVIEPPKPTRIPLYTYRIIGYEKGGDWFVFRHRIIPGKGRRKAEIAPDWQGDNIEGRFATKEEAAALRDRLEEAATCNKQ
jgi:hypothetical protein